MAQGPARAHRSGQKNIVSGRELPQNAPPLRTGGGSRGTGMELLASGLNHTTAELSLRERLTFEDGEVPEALRALLEFPGVREAALLSTCNRTEIYCLVDGESPDLPAWLARWHREDIDRVRRSTYEYRGNRALRHLMRVAAGLDSQVLGEPQVLGQLRDAYARAHEYGAVHGELAGLFQQVFSVAKQIRTETGIGANPVSVAYAAVSFARHIFADLASTRALLIGAGEMIELAARHLREQGVAEIIVANRTLERARELVDELGGHGVVLEEIPVVLENVDIVISCTASPVPVVGKGTVERALKRRRHRPIFMVDIAVPRDIEPEVGELQDVYLYTVDDLHEAIQDNLRQRQQAARDAERIISAALSDHERARREQEAVDTLRRYRRHISALGEQELQRARGQLRNGHDPAEILARMQHNLVKKIMHGPSVELRRLAAENRMDALLLARELLLAHADDDDDGEDEDG